MNRIITMIVRIVILEFVRRGSNMAINRMTRGKSAKRYDADDGLDDNLIEHTPRDQMNRRDIKRRTRFTRRF